jgi:glycosyltransferase involved in cell wall biosynthesis
MTITIVLPFINLTGGIRVLLDYANWLHDAGHRVTVVYPRWPYQFQYTRRQQWGEFRKHLAHNGCVPWFPLRCRLECVPLIRGVFLPKADVVVAAGWPVAHDVSRLPASHGRKVLIVFHHESGTGPEDRIRAIYGLPYYRIAFSQFVRTTITAQFGCEIHDVVPNGVDTSRFFPDGEAEPASALLIYHPDPRKGGDTGVAALTQLRARHPGITLRACGTVRPETWPQWLPFEFHPDDATLRRRYSQSTVLLYPSRHEGFGLPPLEAMACGCPPVTTGVGAVPEYAADGVNAAVVKVGDVGAMVDRLSAILHDRGLRERQSRAGLATAERYSLARVAPMFADALTRAATS